MDRRPGGAAGQLEAPVGLVAHDARTAGSGEVEHSRLQQREELLDVDDRRPEDYPLEPRVVPLHQPPLRTGGHAAEGHERAERGTDLAPDGDGGLLARPGQPETGARDLLLM